MLLQKLSQTLRCLMVMTRTIHTKLWFFELSKWHPYNPPSTTTMELLGSHVVDDNSTTSTCPELHHWLASTPISKGRRFRHPHWDCLRLPRHHQQTPSMTIFNCHSIVSRHLQIGTLLIIWWFLIECRGTLFIFWITLWHLQRKTKKNKGSCLDQTKGSKVFNTYVS